MNRVFTTGMAALAFATLAGSLMAHDDDDRGRDPDGRFTVRANLEGFQEVPALGNGPVGTQTCPAGPAELSGVITPDLVIGPSGTGIEAGAMAEIVAAIRNGTAYANVHSEKWQAGEIRGQLH